MPIELQWHRQRDLPSAEAHHRHNFEDLSSAHNVSHHIGSMLWIARADVHSQSSVSDDGGSAISSSSDTMPIACRWSRDGVSSPGRCLTGSAESSRSIPYLAHRY